MRVSAKQLLYFELVFTVFMMQWLTYIGISNIKVLVPDVINILILMAGYNTLITRSKDKPIKSVSLSVLAFWFITFFCSIFGEMLAGGFKGVVLAIWNMRTFLRPFFYMLLCYSYLEREDLDRIFNIAYKLQFINVLFSLFQYYIQNFWMDQNGGIFAPIQGCNKYSNVYCCLMITWVLARYVRSKANIANVVLTFGCCVVVAIYSELKLLFVEMVAITLLSILFSGGGKKTLRVLIIGVLVLYFGIYLLKIFFPESFNFLADYELFMWYAKDMSYSNTEVSVNRLSGIDVVNKYMFGDNLLKKLFGFGWGATGNIPFVGLYSLVSLVYRSLGYVLFTYSWIYAELGIIGLVLFYSIFVITFLSVKSYCPYDSDADGYGIISKTMIAMTVFLTVYDSSWITEGTAFMCALGIAAGFIAQKE